MRTVLSLVFLVAILWASCTVKLGAFTLAEHVDRIGETEQAQELLDGTRGRISPVLEDMKTRIFGEYVEAPTRAPKASSKQERPAAKPPQAALRTAKTEASGVADSQPSRGPSSAEAARLPGAGRKRHSPRDGS